MKKTQLVMVWFLPLIVIGGLFNPWLGYLVIGMMAFFLFWHSSGEGIGAGICARGELSWIL